MGIKNTTSSHTILSLLLRKSLRKISIRAYNGRKRIGVKKIRIIIHSPPPGNDKRNTLFIWYDFINNENLKH